MVNKDKIEEIISKSIVTVIKCSPSDDARKLGASVTVNSSVDENGTRTDLLTYDDGTVIERLWGVPMTFERGDGTTYESEINMFASLTYNGKKYDLSYGDSDMDKTTDDFFRYQKDFIVKEYGEDGWDFFCKYSTEFGTYQGWNLNDVLRGKRKLSEVTDEDGDFYISPFLLENHDRFVEMEKTLPVNEDFATVRIVDRLHRNDSIGKVVVSDKGHTSTSTIGELEHYETYGDYMNGWFIFTLNEKDRNIHGAYLGNAIKETDGYDFEREVNYAPNQEFERLLIDDENKFIIQRPI